MVGKLQGQWWSEIKEYSPLNTRLQAEVGPGAEEGGGRLVKQADGSGMKQEERQIRRVPAARKWALNNSDVLDVLMTFGEPLCVYVCVLVCVCSKSCWYWWKTGGKRGATSQRTGSIRWGAASVSAKKRGAINEDTVKVCVCESVCVNEI